MDSIGDAQGFSGKTPITPSGDFSVETLTVSKLQEVDLVFSIFFSIYFHYSIFRTRVRIRVKDHAVTQQVTSDDMVTSHMIYGRNNII